MTGMIRKTIASAVKAARQTVHDINRTEEPIQLFNVTSAVSGSHLGTLQAHTPSEAKLIAIEQYGIPVRVW